MEDSRTHTEMHTQLFDPNVIGNIKRILQMQKDSGSPQSFEIHIDGFRVIPRTQDISRFDSLPEFIHSNAQNMLLRIYRGIKTPNCTNHYFRFPSKETVSQPQTPAPPAPALQYLNGPEMESRLQELMEKERLVNKVIRLEEKLAEKEAKLADAEEYMGKLQDGVERVKLELESSKSVWGERLLQLAQNPPQWVQMMIASKGNYTPVNGPETLQGDVSFSKKSPLTEEQQRYMEVIRQMEELLDETQLDLVMQINDKLIQQPKLIPDVADLVGVSPS